MAREQGHHLLKRLGKTKLRPGGVHATNWLFDKIHFSGDTKVLEVACNEGAHLIGFAKTYGNPNYGIDNNREGLKEDEGEEGRLKIMENALRDENREQFLEMFDFFTKAKDNLYYIAIKSQK